MRRRTVSFRDLGLQEMIHSTNHSLIGNPRCTCLPIGNLCLHFPLYYSTFGSLALRNFLIEFIIPANAVHMPLTNLLWRIAFTWSFSFQGSLLFPRGFSVLKMVPVSASQWKGGLGGGTQPIFGYKWATEGLTPLTKKPLRHALFRTTPPIILHIV